MREGWEIKKLGEVCEVLNGLWIGKKEPFINICVIRNTNFTKDCRLNLDNVAYIDAEVKQFSSRKLKVGDIIVEKSGGSDKQPVGRVVLFNIEDGDYSFSNFTSTLRVKDGVVLNPNFLHKCLYAHYLRGETFRLQSKTTGIHNLDMKGYLMLPIPIPPLPLQEKIVSELDLLSGVIEKKRQQLKELNNLAHSIFYDMFGDPITNEMGWEVKKLGEVCKKLFAGGDVPKENFSLQETDEYNIPIYSNGIGDKALYGYTNISRVEDVSLTISGRGTIGYCELRTPPFFPVVRLIVATPNDDIDPIVLKFILNTMDLKGTGGAIPQLTVPMVKILPIILPPLPLQQSFAAKVEAIEQQKALIKQSLAETETLFNSRMEHYFGEE